jgi:phosphoenolpyruvate-protein kinase (PTS system EI component)
MRAIPAIPYVPGRVRGVLRFGAARASADAISVVPAAEIPRLAVRSAGIIGVDAAPLSHEMIRLFGAGIPTVILSRKEAGGLPEGREVWLDGLTGTISDSAEGLADEAPPPPPFGVPVTTADGVAVSLRASVASSEAAARARANGATSIGLLRSEYLEPPDGRVPDTAYFRSAFGELCEAARPLPVTVRLVDAAGDKCPAWLGQQPDVLRTLGLQGSRLFDTEPTRSVVLAQVTALGALAAAFDLSILVPFITSIDELRRWRDLILGTLPAPLPVGTMAETPAALLALPELLAAGDLVGVGCNDLMQCLFAADRDLAAVAHLMDPYAPAVYRFLRLAASTAGRDLDRVHLCGLLPQLPGVMPLLIGLGFRAFSVEPVLIPWLAATVQTLDLASAVQLAEDVCAAPDARAVRELIHLPGAAPWALGGSAATA